MPRPSQVDPDFAIDAAMAVFWARGYGAASMDELTQATGVSRYGLYALFGDKRGLFLAALERYQQVIVNRLFAGVEAPDASIDQIRSYFEGLLGLAASGQGRWGCLMVNTAIERADAGIDAVIAAYRLRLRTGFAQALGPGRSDQADLLVSLAFGIQVQARAGVDPSSLARAATAAL